MKRNLDTMQEAKTTTPTTMDENLQSRQIAVYGRDAMHKLGNTHVLISGMSGLGAEVAKNVILANVKSVTLHDTNIAKMEDLASHFYLTEQDVTSGKNRAVACAHKMQELNPAVNVVSSDSKVIDESLISKHNIIVLIGHTNAECVRINTICHQKRNISFIRGDARGLFGSVFCDFGPEFTVLDQNGENVRTAIITSIAKGKDPVVTCHDDERLDFEDGDHLQFTEVKGMTELNHKTFPIKDVKAYSFTLSNTDTSSFSDYKSGGIVTQVKIPKVMKFKPYSESLITPGEFLESDFSKFGRPLLLHSAMRAIDQFVEKHDGALPSHTSSSEWKEVVDIVKTINPDILGTKPEEIELNTKIIMEYARQSRAVINPMAAFLGGIIGQEVTKAATAKFTPLNQWFHFDALECLPGFDGTTASTLNPPSDTQLASKPSRYDANIIVFGQDVQQKLLNLKLFMVGAGALGCEFVKNFAMMGIACGDKGEFTMTDDDTIEKSNLSRQFLFRSWNISQQKSVAAAAAGKVMNDKFKVKALTDRVSQSSENIFNDVFWNNLDIVVNALDNVKARLYVDQRCVLFGKPLFESGTLGPKGNTQVVIPHLTENYGASTDPPEKEAPQCTLHSFPHNIDHCLSWSRSEFIGQFESAPSECSDFVSGGSSYVNKLKSSGMSTQDILEKISIVKDNLPAAPKNFEDCIEFARLRFEEYFSNRVKQLLFIFPQDSKTRSGLPFWSAPKRMPTPLTFNPQDTVHMKFIISCANLRAKTFGIQIPSQATGKNNLDYFKSTLSKLKIPVFTPKSDVVIDTDEKKTGGEASRSNNNGSSSSSSSSSHGNGNNSTAGEDDSQKLKTLLSEIGDVSKYSSLKVSAEEFDKDSETNFHMDFVAAAGNLRARNYDITEVDQLHATLIAGKIIPAIATTTALATGLVCFEMMKFIQTKPFASYRNSFVNLALPLFAMSEPMPPSKITAHVERRVPDPINHPEYVEEENIVAYPDPHTVWDKLEIDIGDITMAKFIEYCKTKHGITCSSFSILTKDGRAPVIYNELMPSTKERVNMKITDIVEQVSKEKIDPTCNFLLPGCVFENEDGDPVEVAQVVYRFRSIPKKQ